jgi:hypothetical protein
MKGQDQEVQTHPVDQQSEKLDRRGPMSDRRKSPDRRLTDERRSDNWLAPAKQPKTIKAWLRSLTNSRLGVDRRKRVDRRANTNRRQQRFESILTKEEIADLLGE